MDTNTLLAKGRSIARGLKSISRETGKEFTMDTKPGRFRLQKAVYLLKCLRYPPAAKYSYNIYLNGPYSPDLAEAYYALEDDGLSGVSPAHDVPRTTLRTVSDALAGGDDFLEGLTTILDGLPRERTLAAAMAWARSIKPHLTEPTWKEVRVFLAGHPELTRRT
jgi:hypothetical protein